MKYIIIFSSAKTGGRALAQNLSDISGAEIIAIRKNNNKLIANKIIDVILGLVRILIHILKSEKKSVYILEGLIPSYFSILRLISNKIFVTRVGRVYENNEKILFALPHIFANKIISPSKCAASIICSGPIFKNIINLEKKIIICENPLADVKKYECISNKIKKILIVGRLNPAKRLDLSIKVAEKIKEVVSEDVEITVAGITKIEAVKFGLKIKNIKFMGRVDNMHDLYVESDVLVNCGLNEGFSYASFEAAQYGVPTISMIGLSAQNEYIENKKLPGIILNKIGDIKYDTLIKVVHDSFALKFDDNHKKINKAYFG